MYMGEETKIAVVGLGYVGLPSAIAFHDAGFTVRGVDIDKEVVNRISNGHSHLIDASTDLEIPKKSHKWAVTTKVSEIVDECDIFLITVPTPVDEEKNPDLSLVKSAIKSLVLEMDFDCEKIIVVESTLYPGATMKIFREIKEEIGRDFPASLEIAYSPERVSPGDMGKTTTEVAKIVGANDPDTGYLLSEIYSKITNSGCRYVGSIEVAEAAKMIENTQRDIDIAFVNELAKILPKMGLDVAKVIDAASTKWNFHAHHPGIGVGGHCIPVDPYYYIQASRDVGSGSEISPVARNINESMPYYSAELISNYTPNGETIAIFGLAYKPNVGDTRESPVYKLIEALILKGYKIKIWDPLVEKSEKMPSGAMRHEKWDDAVAGSSIVVLATAHDMCLDLDWAEVRRKMSGDLIFDGPRKLRKEKMETHGFRYRGVGLPDKENEKQH